MNDFGAISVRLGIVAYNTPKQVLDRTLASCSASELRPEIVVLCNSPIEEYQAEVVTLCNKYSALCLDRRPNRGFGAGHNEIWRTSSAKYYVCCNPDIAVAPNAISELVRFAESTSDAVLLMPKVLNEDGTIQALARQHLTPWRWCQRQIWRVFPKLIRPYEIRFDYSKTQPVEFVTGCFFMVSKMNMEKLGGFDESFFLYAEDADISRTAQKFGLNYFLAESSVKHAWSTNWARNPSAVIHELRSLKRYFLKHGLLG